MRYLVTGGCGFIGSNFIRYLLSAHSDVHVINLDKLTYAGNPKNLSSISGDDRYEFVKADICDTALVKKLMPQVDIVVHFAAESHVDRSIDKGGDFVVTNAVGTNALLEAAKEAGIKKFIHFSTDEVYGSIEEGEFTESDQLNPTSPYSAAKASSDLLALAYWKTHQVPVTVIRASNNFGPYQFPEKVIPLFITNLIEGKKVPLYGTGNNRRDWLFVGDCVKGVDYIIEKGVSGEIYNLGGGTELSNNQLTQLILSEFEKGEDQIQKVEDRAAHDFRYGISTEKLDKLGYTAQSDFSESLKVTADWYRQNHEWWKPLKKDKFTVK